MKSFEDTDVLCVAVLSVGLCLALNIPATWTALEWVYTSGLSAVHETAAFLRTLV
ncbi:MAG TPA: hypothetical protein VK422_05270 [Pyrinomonadaceae bacterium]|nr:hypothetical protein [Pyrinomonadaceae bacterium]